ncbi:unnamed protein product [Euphydryas editha]|uniref:3-oxoacyl-[acyl-carrier-protein] reductase FabG n=1 Tax=Euphydryas editha TaxID=104508 RepID=A0AAU9U840_EUPED|nr:unnamed protein product [Euphydryas editha]
MSFSNKVVIITGAGSGIGAATAISFAKEGANVVIVGRNEQKLEKVKEKCAKSGNGLLVVRADISNEQDAKKIINETIDKFNKLDVLVNNAGIVGQSSILSDNVLSSYDTIMNTNLRAVVHITNLAAPHLIKTKGNIINISSVAGKMTAIAGDVALTYAVSKAALDHFTRFVAAELASHGVRVNSISPGPVSTGLLDNAVASLSMSLEDMERAVPLGRVSEPEEIADLILFLASDKAKAITGSDYVSDNGLLLK